MKILVTAGNTQVPIDRVRCITSVFSGRTGTGLARHAYERGHDVTLLTSHPELVEKLDDEVACLLFRTFDDLEKLMEQKIVNMRFDAIICCAAVSDFRVAGVYAPPQGTHFAAEDGIPFLSPRTAAKVSSGEPELWLRLLPTPKLIDRVRRDWGFQGQLVKFKLEADLSLARLVEVAEQSRRHSQADWMVANLYDGSLSSFFLGPLSAGYEKVARRDLPARLFDLLEARHGELSHG